MEDPLISIVVPVFNRERYIDEAVQSILQQTYPDWELILVDDGSSDGSARACAEYVARYGPKIRFLTHKSGANLGASASRNLGASVAKGSYVAYLDSDDKWLPKKLEQQVALCKIHPEVGLFLGSTQYWYPQDEKLNTIISPGAPLDRVVEPPELFHRLYPIGQGMAPSVNSILVKKEVLTKVGGWEDSFRWGYGDQAFLCKVYLSEPLYIASTVCDCYRQHAQSIMGTDLSGERYWQRRLIFLRWMQEWMRTNRPDLILERSLVDDALSRHSLRRQSRPLQYFRKTVSQISSTLKHVLRR